MAKVNLFIQIFAFAFFYTVSGEENPSTSINSVISILDEYYISTPIKTFKGKKPSELRMNNDEIYLKIGDATHYYKRGDKSTKKLKYNVTFESKQYLIDNSGNRVTIDKKGFVYLKHEKFDEKLKVTTESGITKQITNDANRQLIFVLAGSRTRQTEDFTGTLFVFNSKKPERLGGRVITHVVKNFGNKVLAVFVEKTKGTVLIALDEPENQWSLIVLDPLKSIVCPPPPNIKSINKKALLAAIGLAAEEIVETYESSLIDEKKSNAAKNEIAISTNKNSIFYVNAGSSREDAEWNSLSESEPKEYCAEWEKKLKEAEAKVNATEVEYNKLYDQTTKLVNEIKATKNIKGLSTLKGLKPNQLTPKDTDKYICILEKDFQDLLKNFDDADKQLKEIFDSRNDLHDNPNEVEYEINPRLDAE